jgi:hypothetical protein
MARKTKASSELFTTYEHLLYLLAEIEILVGSGTIGWPSGAATAARRRLDILVTEIGKLEGDSANE